MVNALAGGGTLITFPTLLALGVPAVAANVTNTVSLTAGYLGGAFAQRADLRTHHARLPLLLGTSVGGGLLGAALLLRTSESSFRHLVPFLILFACALLLCQDLIKRWVGAHVRRSRVSALIVLPLVVCLASVYGGYFGAGLGIVFLAVLGLLLDEELRDITALKQLLSLVVNSFAALFFVFSGQVAWRFVPVMAVSSLLGGHLGGRLVGRFNAKGLRAFVVLAGILVALRFWW